MPKTSSDTSKAGQERLQVLRMVEDQTITPDEASRLLEALDRLDRPRARSMSAYTGPRDVRVRITNTRNQSQDVNLALPITWVESGLGLINRLAPGKVPDFSNVLRSLDSSFLGHILDLQNGDDHVEIIVEARGAQSRKDGSA